MTGTPTAERMPASRTETAKGAPGAIGRVVDPGRTAGLGHQRGKVVSAQAKPPAHGKELACPAPGGDESGRAVGLVDAYNSYRSRRTVWL